MEIFLGLSSTHKYGNHIIRIGNNYLYTDCNRLVKKTNYVSYKLLCGITSNELTPNAFRETTSTRCITMIYFSNKVESKLLLSLSGVAGNLEYEYLEPQKV